MAVDYQLVVASCGSDDGGRGRGGCGENQAMDRSAWPANRMMRVTELAEAAAILQSSGVREGGVRRRVKLMALDCKAYYRIVIG